ncbi:MAG: hypothetical protein JNK31_01560 [Candidatus Competibacter sp.]|nr:hypothetical protein [Candidatus Competibacter sp.]
MNDNNPRTVGPISGEPGAYPVGACRLGYEGRNRYQDGHYDTHEAELKANRERIKGQSRLT